MKKPLTFKVTKLDNGTYKRKIEQKATAMNTTTYESLISGIDARSTQAQWLCDGLTRALSNKVSVNLMALAIVYKTSRLLSDLSKAELACDSCNKEDCTGVLAHSEALKRIRDCLYMVVDRKKDVILHFVAGRLEKLADDIDNKVENYGIGSDEEILHLVSAASAKYSK